jgi:two-component system phosphate regulon sensor histidine kinase PhoR
MRANFISMVSHELRTPLNTINGFLEIVLDGQVGPLNERQHEFLEYAHISTQQLATLVEDILFISKADSGQFTLRRGEVPIAKLIAQVLNSLQAVAEKAEVRLVAEVAESLAPIPADELRLQQVLTNLLNNAIKFSAAQSEVSLRVRAEGEELVFTVADHGKGIAAEDHQRIFERFYQSEGGARARAGGYGLGLSIAKLIVEQHGGRIWVESTLGEGATFAFTMPTATLRSPGQALEV